MTQYRDYLLGFVLWLLAVLVALVANWSLAFGGTVRLAWDHDGAEGYRLYMAELGQPLAKVWQGSEKSAQVDLVDGKEYWS